MTRKFFRMLVGRRLFVICMLLLQLAFIIFLISSGTRISVWIEYSLTLISILVVLHVVGSNTNTSFKLIWVVLILTFPVFGGLFYLWFNYQTSTNSMQKEIGQVEEHSRSFFYLPGNNFEQACIDAPECKTQMTYLQKYAGFPVYANTYTEYLTPGEVKFERLLESLKKAEKYIFLEYFIIQEGVMWNTILDILKEKAANGVDVRIIYDDMGCFLLLPENYPKQLEAMGIQCVVFNPFRPFLTVMQNNRDHRKIAIIDGKTAFTGGINLADEYINAKDRYGHWKDAAVMLDGCAAWSFTVIFLQMWAVCTKKEEDINKFYPWKDNKCDVANDGLIQPYADSPMDDERVCEQVYLQIINAAKDYIFINTPYLIVSDAMLSALSLAAKGGVDVRIVTPHRWDKWYVHMTTRSYYLDLIKCGVKIYEYTDGFIHSKTFVSDGQIAAVGTANLDFRSLYLHFECGVWMYKSKAVNEVYSDFMNTIEKCHQINEEECKSGRIARLIQDILRLFEPLL